MKSDELFRLGKIVRTFGSKGELVLQSDSDMLTKIKKLESVFIKLNENLVPFFIDTIQHRPKNQAVVKFMDVNNAEEATALAGHSFYIDKSLLPKSKSIGPYSFGIEGYTVFDAIKGEIGIITAVIELPQQSILSIDFNGIEILIPVVEEIVKQVDKKKKAIFIEAPEGLIDLYLS